MDTDNLSEFGSSRRARQIVGAITLFLALTLGGPLRLWGQGPCSPGFQGPPVTSVTVSVSPTSVVSGPDTNPIPTLTATVTTNAVVSLQNTNGAMQLIFYLWYLPINDVQYEAIIGCGNNSTTVQFPAPTVVQSTTFTLYAGGSGWPGNGTTTFTAVPGPAASPANLGVCPSGESCKAGAPINLTDGNVWIQQRDYSMPGLGGGLQLSRVWNSRLSYAAPPTLAGMFGLGWRSTYEEMLAGPDANNNLTYWRADGSGWTFAYNTTLNTYSLASPPNERAQLVVNPATGGFTLTLADGTQRVFNSQNLLAAVIDRNNNQTTLAYDSSNRLTSVTSPGGHALNFTYGDSNNPMQATTVQDVVGVVATYTYDSMSRLTLVSYPDGSALNFTYDPNSSMILSVADSQGKLLEAHTYDAQNRGLTSARAYGADSVSLVY